MDSDAGVGGWRRLNNPSRTLRFDELATLLLILGAGVVCEGSLGIRKSANCLASDFASDFADRSCADCLGLADGKLALELSSAWLLGGLKIAENFVDDSGNVGWDRGLDRLS